MSQVPFFLYLGLGVTYCASAARLSIEGSGSETSPLSTGDSHTCEEEGTHWVNVTLGRKLGEGKWGNVFEAEGGRYAIKVEKDMTWRARDRWSRYKDYEHECG